MTEKTNESRKRRKIIAAIVIAVIVTFILGLVSCRSCAVEEAVQVDTGSASVAPSAADNGVNQSDTSDEQNAEAAESDVLQELEGVQVHTDNNAPASNKSSSSSNNKSATPTPATNQTTTATKKPAAPQASAKEPTKRWVEETTRVWVVDKPAWTEVSPIYETRELSICNVCGADITGNTSAHGKAHMLEGEGSGYHSEVKQIQTGTNTINHPEEGRWEMQVTGGHWE